MTGVWWAILSGFTVLYFFLTVYVLPGAFFKAGYFVSRTARGLRRFRGEDGCAIVYEPQREFRPYICQYILSERDGQKVMLCKLTESFSYIEYDIVLFSKRNHHFKTIRVREEIGEPGYTAEVPLPARTSYALPVVHAVDGKRLGNAGMYKFPIRHTALFAALVGGLTVLAVVVVKLCMGGIFGDVYIQDFMTDGDSVLFTVLLSFFSASVAAGVAVLCILWKLKRLKKEAK